MSKICLMIKSNALKKVLWAIEFVKIGYWAPKGQKQQSDRKKGSLGGPKSENPLYLSNYENTRSKNWQMLRTNWYNCLRNGFLSHRFCKNQLLGIRGAKIAVKQQKGPKGGLKSENLLYLSNYDSIRPKNWQMLKTNWCN